MSRLERFLTSIEAEHEIMGNRIAVIGPDTLCQQIIDYIFDNDLELEVCWTKDVENKTLYIERWTSDPEADEDNDEQPHRPSGACVTAMHDTYYAEGIGYGR